MSNTTVPQTAVMPEGVHPIVEFPIDDTWKVTEKTRYVAYFEYPDGTRDCDSDPTRPVPDDVRKLWLDERANIVTFLGLYKIMNVENGVAVGLLTSVFPCTVYEPDACTGHDLLPDGTILNPTRHDAPDRDLVSLMGEYVVYGQDFVDEEGPGTVLSFPSTEITTNGEGLVHIADELEVLVALLRKRAFEILPEDPESVPLDHVDEGHDEMEPPC
ncbi:hypothetical protein [Rathayibacter sp. AY1F9]|uniref:hypothetical protein n=1 Tax=Rathayibacter sp. AY1F9 TaxID=2080563 RepID=UPI000CE8AD48|nr:hypothetical protein [Rathayibacter sp. AY1F9]PPH30515.1 hypothetical protein C5C37_04075 [Rathayibacter sp. AY1F9]